jgi:hypothetical protein
MVGASDAPATLEQAVQLRLRGEHFFSRFAFTHPGLIRVLKSAAENLELPNPESRRIAFERLARLEGINDARGRPIRTPEKDIARAATLAIIARLSEASVVCTQEERRMFELLFERALAAGFDTKMTAPSPSGCVPAALDNGREKDAFLVWAPTDPAWRTALAVYALEQLNLRVIVVCGEGALSNVRARFVRPQDADAALARARAILDLSVSDPGDALALANLGLSLAVSYLSGAYELLTGVAIYRPWMQRDIELAALTALGLSSPRTIGVTASAPIYCAPATDGPLVAISDGSDVEGQTYAAITRNEDATYAAQIPAGAVLFDTHVATLVEAIERSGADRAVSDGIRRTAESPGYALVSDAFSLTRVQARGQAVVRIPRVTGVLSA